MLFRRALFHFGPTTSRRRDQPYRAVWDQTPIGMAVLNRHGNVEQLNPAMEALLGYPAAAWRGAPFAYFAHADESHELRQRVGELMAGTRRSAQLEQRFRRRERGSIVARVTLSAIGEEGRRPEGVVVTCEDVTALREAERALYLRERQFQDLFDAVPVGIFHAAPDGTILALNWALRELLHVDRGVPLAGLTVARLCADPAAEAEVRRLQRDGNVTLRRIETRLRATDGRALAVVLAMRLVTNARGDAAYHEAIVVDGARDGFGLQVTDVVHSFKNLLTSISGYGELIGKQLDTQRADLDEILKASQRAADLARQVMIVGRLDVADDRLLNLNELIDGAGASLSWLCTTDIELRQLLAADLRPVRADASQLERVLLNLALNARDAMPQGGALTFETTNVTHAGVPHVRMVVRDTGAGMDDRVRGQLFKPFFTTKPPEKGTGLGLYTVDRIVARLGGAIRVESEPGQGTAFVIDLPAADESGGQPLIRNCSASAM